MGYMEYCPYEQLQGSNSASQFYHTNNGVISEAYERDNLKVTGGTGVTSVSPGKALLKSVVYDSDDDVTMAHDSTAANHRYDAVVLHWASSSLTLKVVKGAEAAQPNYPTLTETASSKYLVLAYVYLTHPFTSGTTAIPNTSIQDQRKFIETPQSYTFDHSSKHNFAYNSELAVYSAASGTGTADLPEGWAVEANAIVVTRYDNTNSDMPRGYVCGWYANTGAVIYTQMQTPAAGTRAWGTSTEDGVPVTALIRMKLITGKKIAVRLQSGAYTGAAPTWTTIAESYYTYNTTTAAWFNVLLRGITLNSTANTTDNALRIEIEDLTPATASNIYFGYTSATFGNVPIYYQKQSEVVMLKNNLYAYYDGTFRVSSEIHAVTEAELVGLAGDLRFLILDVRVRDSGSGASADPCIMFTSEGGNSLFPVYCGRAPNDQYVRQQAWIPVCNSSTTTMTRTNLTATGANTFEATIRVAGVVT